MKRLLWYSCHPFIPSGYGVQTKLMVGALVKNGYHVDIATSTGQVGHVSGITLAGKQVRVLPHSGYFAKYGTDTIEMHYTGVKADAVLSFIDCFILQPETVERLNWGAWVPVDSNPMMTENNEAVKASKMIISPTKWGQGVIETSIGVKGTKYLPCCYSNKEYFISDYNKCKERVEKQIERPLPQGENTIIANVVSNNSGYRKNYQAIMTAWRIVLDEYPESLLFVNADPTGYMTMGTDLFEMMKIHGIPESTVVFPNAWRYMTGSISTGELNDIYNISDVHINACYGEGFGIPIIEAQAAGCPCVVPAFGGANEILKTGARVAGSVENTVKGGFQYRVDRKDLAKKIILVAKSEYSKQEISSRVTEYEIETVTKRHLLPIVEELCSQGS